MEAAALFGTQPPVEALQFGVGEAGQGILEAGGIPLGVDNQRRLADDILNSSYMFGVGHGIMVSEFHHRVISQKQLQGAMAVVAGYPGVAADEAVLQAVHLKDGDPGQQQ